MNQYTPKFEKYPDFPDRFEKSVREFYTKILKPGDFAIDCGAHVGKHAIPISRLVEPSGRCYAFEPIVEKFQILFDRSSDLKSLHPINAAVFDKNTLVEFTWLPDDPGKSSIKVRRNLERESVKKKIYPVLAVRLDDYLPDFDFQFIKIDIEGAELFALRGMQSIIERSRPAVHFELGIPSISQFGYQARDVYDIFSRLDYSVFDVLGNTINGVEEFEDIFSGGFVYDYFALPLERAEESPAITAVKGLWA